MALYATVNAVNSVNLSTYQFSNKIAVDSSPPLPGVVVELSQDYEFDSSGDLKVKDTDCQTPAGACLSYLAASS